MTEKTPRVISQTQDKRSKTMARRNDIARDLRTPKYRLRVVKSQKVYSRKVKHKGKDSV
jgi:hypothetical protein